MLLFIVNCSLYVPFSTMIVSLSDEAFIASCIVLKYESFESPTNNIFALLSLISMFSFFSTNV